jgi:phospholipid transport system substrate-binding protein
MKYVEKIGLILMVIFIVSAGNVVAASPAQDQLKQSIDEILAVLRNPELKTDAQKDTRREALEKIVEERFDFDKMSQLSLARHWKERSDAEKSDFIALFGRLLKDTYISKMEGYTDEQVVFINELIKKQKAQIDTKIITQTVEIPINYRMFTRDNVHWLVYDMVIEGVSLIGNYRSQFGQMLEKDSFEELMNKLKKK